MKTVTDAKEYLRAVFRTSALDVTQDFDTVRGFVEIFAGEPEATAAVEQCGFLTGTQRRRLMRTAVGLKD